MKHIALTVLTLTVLFIACSKNSPNPVAPPNGPGNGAPHDTTPTPPKHDTTPTPPTETPGKTEVVGVQFLEINYLGGGLFWLDCSNLGVSFLRLQSDDTSHYAVDVVNARKGTSTISYLTPLGDTTVQIRFSNIDSFETAASTYTPDTAGKIQFHVYRKDGRNFKPGVKDMFLVLGTVPGNLIGKGDISINEYPGIRGKLTADSAINIIQSKATMSLVASDGF